MLEEEFRDQAIDFSLVGGDWTSKKGKWAADAESVEKRAREVRQWLKARPEKDVVLVTHGGKPTFEDQAKAAPANHIRLSSFPDRGLV